MSRIGRLPIKLEGKVKAALTGRSVHFEGPKGKVDVVLPPGYDADTIAVGGSEGDDLKRDPVSVR